MVFLAVPIVQPVIHDGNDTDADWCIPIINDIQYIIIPVNKVALSISMIFLLKWWIHSDDCRYRRGPPSEAAGYSRNHRPVKDFLQCTDFLKVFVDLKARTKSKTDLFDTSNHLPIQAVKERASPLVPPTAHH